MQKIFKPKAVNEAAGNVAQEAPLKSTQEVGEEIDERLSPNTLIEIANECNPKQEFFDSIEELTELSEKSKTDMWSRGDLMESVSVCRNKVIPRLKENEYAPELVKEFDELLSNGAGKKIDDVHLQIVEFYKK